MILHDQQGAIPTHWLAFELSVLRRLKFHSVAIPFVGEPDLPIYLKHWGARVAANDPARWAFIKAVAIRCFLWGRRRSIQLGLLCLRSRLCAGLRSVIRQRL